MALAVIVGIGSGFFADFTSALQGQEPDIGQAMSLVLASLALFGLGIFGPSIASGLVAGAPRRSTTSVMTPPNHCRSWCHTCWHPFSPATANLREHAMSALNPGEIAPALGERPERLIKLPEVSRRVGLGKSMIYRLIQDGRFPRPYKISPFASRWSEQEIVAWIADVKDGFEGKRRKV